MSKSNAFETALLNLIFNATPIANMADNAASSPLTNLYISLHTADPGEAGNQSTSEIAYTSYTRVAVPRSGSGFTVTGDTVHPVSTIAFPAGTGGSGTASYFGIGTAPSGTGLLLYSGPVTSPIVCGAGITPQLTTGTAVTED